MCATAPLGGVETPEADPPKKSVVHDYDRSSFAEGADENNGIRP
jgi:hypothetical protein